MLKAVSIVLVLFAACSKTERATPNPTPAPAPAPAAPAAAAPPAPTPGAPAEPAADKPPLSTYLSTAAAGTLYEIKLKPEGGVDKHELKRLDEAATKQYLERIGLAQRADGPVVKCPNDAVLELADAAGKPLGSIGFCQDNARFDAPDGTFGGIQATRL